MKWCEWIRKWRSWVCKISKRNKLIGFGVIVLVALLGIGCISYYIYSKNQVEYEDISWKQLTNLTVYGNITRLEVVDRDWIRVALVPGNDTSNKTIRFNIGSVISLQENLENMQHDNNIDQKDYLDIIYTNESSDPSTIILMVLITNLLLLQLYFVMVSRRQCQSFKIIDPEKITVRFRDVGGCEEAKIEIMEFVNYLNNPDQYTKLGARPPKGAILTGPPGTGKTLLAKATAGEANASFIAASGSEFVEMYVGVGSSRIRKLFQKARKNAPCILFIDEIDAIGGERDGTGYSCPEDDKTLNQLLVELDGFNTTENVFVFAATNRADKLDKALLRKGRFDRQIEVPKPDIKGRVSIFKVHLTPSKTDLNKQELSRMMAALTPGFTGADIANVCNEAALIAARNSSTSVEMQHFEHAIERCILGIEKKSNVLTQDEKRTIAYHEAGHAVAGWFLEFTDPLIRVSVIPRGNALGYVHFMPNNPYLLSKEQLFDRICSLLGGRVSEEIFFGRITTGARDDLERVTKSAYDQVTIYGMSETVGNVSFKLCKLNKPYSEQTAQLIDSEVRLLINAAYTRTKNLIVEHKADVIKVAESLLVHEVLKREDLVQLLGPRPFKEKSTYEQLVEGTGSFEEDTILPDSLKNFNKEKKSKCELPLLGA